MRGWALTASLAIGLAVLAGCADKGGDADVGPGGGGGPALGTLSGVVVDDAIRPMAGAEVLLDGTVNATTGADGTFTFEGVASGAHVLRATLAGYADAVTQVIVAASEPTPLVKLVLLVDVSNRPYAEIMKVEGFVECSFHTGTHSFAACGTGNVGSFIVCAQTGVCQGNVTEDRYITIVWFSKQPDFLVSEVVWTPTQALGSTLRIMLGSANAEQLRFYPETPRVHNESTGPSPVYVTMDKEMLSESGIGLDSWFLAQTFAAFNSPTPGAVLQQRFDMFLTSFYGYQPSPDWRFTLTGETPPPTAP